MTTRRSKVETTSHDDIMEKLEEIEQAGVTGRAEIAERLDAGQERFAKIEQAVEPLSKLIEAMGGEEKFNDLAVDAARGLAALAWVGGKTTIVAKTLAILLAGALALYAMVRFVFFDMWRIPS